MSSKKTTLATALHRASGKPSNELSDLQPAMTKTVAPSRMGKKALTGFFDPAVTREIKQLALNQDSTVQAMLTEAINDLLLKYGRSPIA